MTTPRVLFFSCEAGGAEVLIPVVRLLEAHGGYHVTVACYGHALSRFTRRKISCATLQPVLRDDDAWVERFRPDLLITSATSLPAEDMSEKHLWQHARMNGIPSLAFLDQWQNYALRFSGPRPNEGLRFQPDFINCLNQIGHQEMTAAGFEARRLLMLGHPYLDSLPAAAARLDLEAIRKTMGIGLSRHALLFVSEPIHEYCGLSRGYDQYTILESLLECSKKMSPPPEVLIKLHPKDNPEHYRTLLSRFKNDRVHLLDASVNPLQCIVAVDRVYGISSVMLLESYVLGKETFSIQPNLQIDDPCVLSKYGYIKRLEVINSVTMTDNGGAGEMPFDYRFDAHAFLSIVMRLVAPPWGDYSPGRQS